MNGCSFCLFITKMAKQELTDTQKVRNKKTIEIDRSKQLKNASQSKLLTKLTTLLDGNVNQLT